MMGRISHITAGPAAVESASARVAFRPGAAAGTLHATDDLPSRCPAGGTSADPSIGPVGGIPRSASPWIGGKPQDPRGPPLPRRPKEPVPYGQLRVGLGGGMIPLFP